MVFNSAGLEPRTEHCVSSGPATMENLKQRKSSFSCLAQRVSRRRTSSARRRSTGIVWTCFHHGVPSTVKWKCHVFLFLLMLLSARALMAKTWKWWSSWRARMRWASTIRAEMDTHVRPPAPPTKKYTKKNQNETLYHLAKPSYYSQLQLCSDHPLTCIYGLRWPSQPCTAPASTATSAWCSSCWTVGQTWTWLPATPAGPVERRTSRPAWCGPMRKVCSVRVAIRMRLKPVHHISTVAQNLDWGFCDWFASVRNEWLHCLNSFPLGGVRELCTPTPPDKETVSTHKLLLCWTLGNNSKSKSNSLT